MPLLPPPDEIKIYARNVLANSAAGSVTYRRDVVVRYGATKITADRVVVFESKKRAVAEGHITLVDPDGTAQADRLEFSWDPAQRSSSGENVSIRVGNVSLRARTATFLPRRWTLRDVEATSCLRPRPVYLVTSDLIDIVPGKSAYVHQPRVSLLGKFIAELPTQRPLITPAVQGLRLPAPMYKLNQGLGVTWSGGILAGSDATLTFDARAFQRSIPSAYLQYTKSFVPISKASEIVAPRTDFSERFYYGYLDSVLVPSPEEEDRFLRATRASLSAGGQLNGSVVDRDRNTRYSKVEAVYESGRQSGPYGLLGQARLQGLQREEEGMKGRAIFSGSLGLPPVRLRSNLQTISRLDSNLFVGDTIFGWVRGMGGLSYTPKDWLRLSGGIFGSFEAGNPAFAIDPLYSKSGLLVRADLVNGGFRFSYLNKYDFRRGGYDSEFSINQVVGCVELSYLMRAYPRDQRFGLMLRVQPLIDLLRRRSGEFGGETAPATENGGLNH